MCVCVKSILCLVIVYQTNVQYCRVAVPYALSRYFFVILSYTNSKAENFETSSLLVDRSRIKAVRLILLTIALI